MYCILAERALRKNEAFETFFNIWKEIPSRLKNLKWSNEKKLYLFFPNFKGSIHDHKNWTFEQKLDIWD